ncbi:MAG: cytochrome c3 family protein [Halieaceae bacterium]
MKRPLLLLLLVAGAAYAVLVFLSSEFYLAQQDSAGIATTLPMKFAHVDHAQQRCVECHHNYEDDTGQGLCIDCHYRDPELAPLMEGQFHDLCRSCHMDKAMAREKHGPLRHCVECHQADFLP